MFRWYDKKEVNTGRQREFDYLKGIFMLLIFMIHSFQTTFSPEDNILKTIYIFNSMSGAAIFIFIMGFGSVYSRNSTPAGFLKSSIRLVIYQYLNNLAYVAALLLPYPIVSASLSKESSDMLSILIKIYLQYTNIFFISGIIYLVLALLKKLNAHTLVYVFIGAAVSLAAPFVYGLPVDVPVLGYIVKLLIGEADFVSFTPLYFLPYALFGAAFAKMFRHVRSKRRFYLEVIPVCITIAIIWWVMVFVQHGTDINVLRPAMGKGYICPDLWHVTASISHIMILAAIIFLICEKTGVKDRIPKNPLSRQLLYYNTHISKYYALHVLTYNAAFGLHGYLSFEAWQCWVLVPVCMLTTEAMVRGYNKVYDKIKKRRETRTNASKK